MENANPEWEKIFDENGGEVPVVILDSRGSRKEINGMLQTPGWRLVFADRSAAVFLTNQKADELSLSRADPHPFMYPDGPPKKRL
jgi:hypothetical protein